MKKPLIPQNESKRLLALANLNVLDSEPEERFDRIVRMAQRYFGTEMVLISLVDSNRQWFKSKVGIDVCETDREISFCGHAILDRQLFEITDAKDDERFHDNPFVLGPPFISFYAGRPLCIDGTHNVGTLCLIDPKPRTLTSIEKDMLHDFASCVVDELVRDQVESQKQALLQLRKMTQSILTVQSSFIVSQKQEVLIRSILTSLAQLTKSEYSFLKIITKEPNDAALRNIFINLDSEKIIESMLLKSDEPTYAQFRKTVSGLSEPVISTLKPVLNNAAEQSDSASPFFSPIHSYLIMPILYRHTIVAVLGAINKQDGYGEDLVEYLSAFTKSIGLVLHNR